MSVLAVAVLLPVTPALADGDPASDVLASQTLFLPSDGGVPVAQGARLAGLLRAAQRAGYPVRVALIASKSDLGSITELWKRPASYAHFLGQELAVVYKGTVLVVMPNGFGVAVGGKPVTYGGTLPAPASGGATLATAAVSAVQHLAASAGHTLPLPPLASSAPAGARGGSTDVGAWAAIAIGVMLIGAAWGASLRARPFGSRRAAET